MSLGNSYSNFRSIFATHADNLNERGKGLSLAARAAFYSKVLLVEDYKEKGVHPWLCIRYAACVNGPTLNAPCILKLDCGFFQSYRFPPLVSSCYRSSLLFGLHKFHASESHVAPYVIPKPEWKPNYSEIYLDVPHPQIAYMMAVTDHVFEKMFPSLAAAAPFQGRQNRGRDKANQLLAFLPPIKGDRVLDIGGAPGGAALVFQGHGATVKTVSPASEIFYWDSVRKSRSIVICESTIEDLKLPTDDFYDLIYCDACVLYKKYSSFRWERKNLEIYRSAVLTLRNLKSGGSFVMKVVGGASLKVIMLLQCLSLSFEVAKVLRVPVSRPTGAEFHVVATGFNRDVFLTTISEVVRKMKTHEYVPAVYFDIPQGYLAFLSSILERQVWSWQVRPRDPAFLGPPSKLPCESPEPLRLMPYDSVDFLDYAKIPTFLAKGCFYEEDRKFWFVGPTERQLDDYKVVANILAFFPLPLNSCNNHPYVVPFSMSTLIRLKPLSAHYGRDYAYFNVQHKCGGFSELVVAFKSSYALVAPYGSYLPRGNGCHAHERKNGLYQHPSLTEEPMDEVDPLEEQLPMSRLRPT